MAKKKNDRRQLLEELVRVLGTDCPLEALRRVAELLAQVRAELEAWGLKCEPGRWLNQTPVYLR